MGRPESTTARLVVAAILACTFVDLVFSFPMPQALPIPENRLAPTQHRIALAGEGGMAVSWNTYTKIDTPTVHYGMHPNKLDLTASSQVSETYSSSTTYSNHVKLSRLLPDTMYYYKVSNTVDGFPTLNFTTPPVTAQQKSYAPFKFAVAIDLGTMGPLGLSETTGEGDGGVLLPGERNTIEALAANRHDFSLVWHPGDIGYADYWLKEQVHGYLPEVPVEEGYKVYESILNTFYEQISSVSSYVPYMVGPGNHEANCNNGGVKDKKKGIAYTVDICMPGQRNFSGFQSHWRMPNEESGGKKNMWFSFDYGPVHFVQINTETDFGNGIIAPGEPTGSGKEYAGPFGSYQNEQYDWLNRDLAAVDRHKTPWVIVSGHRPWYAAGKDGCTECQEAFEDIFVKYSVDVAIFGHVHNYQRWDPMKHNTADPNGLSNPGAPWYILNGIAGHYDGMDAFGKKMPAGFRVGFDDTYGWSRFTVHNATHLTHEFVASRNDSVLDKATLYKKHDFGDAATSKSTSKPHASALDADFSFSSAVASSGTVDKMKAMSSSATALSSRQSSTLAMIVVIIAFLFLV